VPTPGKDLREVEKDPAPEGVERVPTAEDLRARHQSLEQLRGRYVEAEARLHELDAEYQAARAAVDAEYGPRLHALGAEAHRLQGELCDAEAVDALLDRPDGQAVADALGLTLPE
jgi:hypothetical protein